MKTSKQQQTWDRPFYADAASNVTVSNDVDLEAKTIVYRYLAWNRARELFCSNKLRLTSPRTWTDPYEAWWCKLSLPARYAPSRRQRIRVLLDNVLRRRTLLALIRPRRGRTGRADTNNRWPNASGPFARSRHYSGEGVYRTSSLPKNQCVGERSEALSSRGRERGGRRGG
jgi:hypothetical protein